VRWRDAFDSGGFFAPFGPSLDATGRIFYAEAMKDSKAQRVPAVLRGLQILELLAGQKKRWTTSEVSRKLRIPKSTTSYLLRTLLASGYLVREEEGIYRLGMKLIALGGQALHGLELREVALPSLRRLATETQTTAHLAVLEGSEAVYIERVPSPGFIQLDTWVGRRMPLHSTSVGKVLLAFLPAVEADIVMQSIALPRFTARTIVSLSRLKQELNKIRDAGVAVDNEENTLGVRCVAAPIFRDGSIVVAALSLTGPVQQVTEERMAGIAEKVQETARQLTLALGGRPPILKAP
jgi:DNA-binding IclR family transcriptional regulator